MKHLNIPLALFYIFLTAIAVVNVYSLQAQVPSIVDSVLLKYKPSNARVIQIKSVSLNAYINLSESGKIVHEKSAQLVLEKDSGGVFIALWNDMTYYNSDSISDHYSTSYFDKKRGSFKIVETGNSYIGRTNPTTRREIIGDSLTVFVTNDTLTESKIIVQAGKGVIQSKWTFHMVRTGLTLNTNWKVIEQHKRVYIVDSLGSETYVIEFKKNQPHKLLRCQRLGVFCTESTHITPNCMFPKKIKKSNVVEEFQIMYGKEPILRKINMPNPKDFYQVARKEPDFW